MTPAEGVTEATPEHDVPRNGMNETVPDVAVDCVTVTALFVPRVRTDRLFETLPLTSTGAADEAVVGVAVAPTAVAVGVAVAPTAVAVGVAVAPTGVAVATVFTDGELLLLQALSATANATRASHGLKFFMHPHNGSGVTYGNRPQAMSDRTSHKAK
jgi:hypothetical protein